MYLRLRPDAFDCGIGMAMPRRLPEPMFEGSAVLGRHRIALQAIVPTRSGFVDRIVDECGLGWMRRSHALLHCLADARQCLGHVLLHCAHRDAMRSEEHTSELQSLMRISYAVLCFKKKNNKH